MNDLLLNIGIMIVIATVFAYLAKLLKQPLILAYFLTGILIGPLFGIITDTEIITKMSEIGVALLLFIIGMEINLKKLSSVGLVSSLGGLIQVIATFSLAFIVAVMMGFVAEEAIYLGLIIVFSSTMVVVKLLSDKREIDTLHGRITVGILLIQDIVAIFALSILTDTGNSAISIILALLKGSAVIAIAVICGKYVFPKIFRFAAKSRELLLLLSISVCLLFAVLFNHIGDIAIYIIKNLLSISLPISIESMIRPGFSISIGAFVAGITLANLPYTIEIIGRIKPLRDFFATIFFISLGLGLTLSSVSTMMAPLAVFIVITLLFKPIIVMFICSFFGYKSRISFLTSISLAQISEFSLIIAAQGLLLGSISQEVFSLTVILAILTIVATTYLIKFEEEIYKKAKALLRPFDMFSREVEHKLEYLPKRKRGHAIVCGYNRIGYSIVNTLRRMKKDILIVDFNPEIITKIIKEKIPCIYGDISDAEVLEKLDLKKASMVISTVPTESDNIMLIRKVKETNKRALVFVTANQIEEALELYDEGADYVILPHFLGGEHFSILIEEFTNNISNIIKTRLKHIEELKKRQNIGHEHPQHH